MTYPTDATPATDRDWMLRAIEVARYCRAEPGRPMVGTVIVDAVGHEIAYGYSRETGDDVHAEASALAKVPPPDTSLTGATLYTTIEPCSQRGPGPAGDRGTACTRLILAAGIRRVVLGWRPPADRYPHSDGYEVLTEAGVDVLVMSELADRVAIPVVPS